MSATTRLLARHIDEIADDLRSTAAAAQAAEALVGEDRPREALELVIAQMLPIHNALILIKLTALAARGANPGKS